MNNFKITDDDFKKVKAARDAERTIKSAVDYMDDVAKRFAISNKDKVFLPFERTKSVFDVRPGELTIFAGYNGHGKSLFINQIMLDFVIENKKKIVIASLEMPVVTTLSRMVTQYARTKNPCENDQNNFFKLTEGLFMFDHIGSVSPETIYAAVTIAKKRFDVDYFVIDSLMRCGIATDDFFKQKTFVEDLCCIAKDTGLHIFLVAHMRKGEKGEHHIPDRYDISGSSDITNQADNVMIFWRNKNKEQKQRENNQSQNDKPDAILKIDKQRNGTGEDGMFKFDYLKNSMCYQEEL